MVAVWQRETRLFSSRTATQSNIFSIASWHLRRSLFLRNYVTWLANETVDNIFLVLNTTPRVKETRWKDSIINLIVCTNTFIRLLYDVASPRLACAMQHCHLWARRAPLNCLFSTITLAPVCVQTDAAALDAHGAPVIWRKLLPADRQRVLSPLQRNGLLDHLQTCGVSLLFMRCYFCKHVFVWSSVI